LSQNGLNALHLAAKEGHVNIVTELLDRGAFVDAATRVCHTFADISSELTSSSRSSCPSILRAICKKFFYDLCEICCL